MPGQTFTGQALVKALSSGELDHDPGLVLSGMVKQSEQADHVSFARGGCDTWIELPTSMIEEAEHVGSRPCEDHSHPVFRIRLKESKDPQARLLGQLLASQPSMAARAPFPGRGLPGSRIPLRGSGSGGPQLPRLVPLRLRLAREGVHRVRRQLRGVPQPAGDLQRHLQHRQRTDRHLLVGDAGLDGRYVPFCAA